MFLIIDLNSCFACRIVSRSHSEKKPGYKRKKKKPKYKTKSNCSNFQSYSSRPSYGKKPKYKKKKKKAKKFSHHHHRLFKVPKKSFGHHVHIDGSKKINKEKKVLKQSQVGLFNNNKAFLAGHSATWQAGRTRTRKRKEQKFKTSRRAAVARRKQNPFFPRILKDTIRGDTRTIHIGI